MFNAGDGIIFDLERYNYIQSLITQTLESNGLATQYAFTNSTQSFLIKFYLALHFVYNILTNTSRFQSGL